MGAMAAMLAGDGSLGVIGPIEVGDAKLYVDGFVAGANSVDPDLEVGVTYTESFSDTTLAAEAATSFIDGGATVLSGTAQMTVGAIGVASERGVLWFGTQSNQTELAPEIVVANQVYHWEVVLADLIEAIKGGDVGGETYDINLANEGEVIEFNEDYDLPEDVPGARRRPDRPAEQRRAETGVAGRRHAATDGTGDRRHGDRHPGPRRRAGGHRRPGDDGRLTSSMAPTPRVRCCRCAASRRGSPASSPTTTSTSTFAPGRSTPSSARTAPARAR